MRLDKFGKTRTYEFCIEGETDQGYPFAETGYMVSTSFDDAIRAVRNRMAKRNEMRFNYGLSGSYTEITELTLVLRRNDDGK